MVFDKSKLSTYEIGGYYAYSLLRLIDDLGIAPFPPANPEDLDNYAWRVLEKEIIKAKD